MSWKHHWYIEYITTMPSIEGAVTKETYCAHTRTAVFIPYTSTTSTLIYLLYLNQIIDFGPGWRKEPLISRYAIVLNYCMNIQTSHHERERDLYSYIKEWESVTAFNCTRIPKFSDVLNHWTTCAECSSRFCCGIALWTPNRTSLTVPTQQPRWKASFP